MCRVCCLIIKNDLKVTETQGYSNTTQLQHPRSKSCYETHRHTPVMYLRARSTKSPVETWTRRTITKRRCSSTPKPSTELKDSSLATRQRVGTDARRSAAQQHPIKIGPASAPAAPPAALVVVDGLYGCWLASLRKQAGADRENR